MRTKPWHVVLSVLALLALLSVTLYVGIRWSSIPDRVPQHFDAAGAADGYAGKSSLIGLLLVGWAIYLVQTGVCRAPSTWNIPGKTPRAYQALRDMMEVLKLLLALMFAYIPWCVARGQNLGRWFLPVTLAAVFGTTAVGIIASLRK